MSLRHLAIVSIVLAGLTASCRADKKPSPSSLADEKNPAKPERPKLYDTQADGNEQIALALSRARAEQKRVLLKFGANWCEWCHKLSKCFEENDDIARVLNENFVLVPIDVDIVDDRKHNADVLERYGNPTRLGLPALVVLDAEGDQLTTKDTAELEEGDHHDPARVLTFLNQWKPTR